MHKWLLLLLVSCGSKGSNIPFWTYTNYSLCELKLNPELESLPFSLVLNLNRYDLPRYDSRGSHRPWLITTDLETKDLGSDLVTEEKIGQISVMASSFESEGVYLDLGWIEPQAAMREAVEGHFLLSPASYRYDIIRRDVASLETENLTFDSPSFFNTVALAFDKIFFTAFINGQSRPFTMNLDGSDKKPLSSVPGFAYGLAVAPGGTDFAFHSNYKVYINDQPVQTPCYFNFGPIWSPDSSQVVFTCNDELWVADKETLTSRFLGSRAGYSGSVPFTTQPDHHGGGSDSFKWLSNGSGVVHGKLINSSIELVVSYLDGTEEQLTFSAPNSRASYPEIKENWLLFTHNQQAKMMDLNTKEVIEITDLEPECNARMGFWQK